MPALTEREVLRAHSEMSLPPALHARRAQLAPCRSESDKWDDVPGEPQILMLPAWRPGPRTTARDLAKSSSRTHRTQTRALRVDRFGWESTQRNGVLSRKTGRQAKFCLTLDQNFLDAPQYATKFIVLLPPLQQIPAFSPGRLVSAAETARSFLAGPLGK